uniref:Uncharacterized protein n=1 Tax=Rhizophora mucronata TaxID=61149 RepID=A0A2P2PSR9_RHIMU
MFSFLCTKFCPPNRLLNYDSKEKIMISNRNIVHALPAGN